MAAITTLVEMRDYLKLRLGDPVINIEMTDDQFDQVIEDTVQDFHRYNYGEGTNLEYIIFTISAGVTQYSMSGYIPYTSATSGTNPGPNEYWDIEFTHDIALSTGLDGINTLFSPQHILLYEQFATRNPWGGGYYSDSGLVLAGYDIALMYLEEIRAKFGKYYRADYLPARKVLNIIPTPDTTGTGILAVYRRENAINLYNHPLVKKLALARCKIQWGRHLNKYGGTLPDGLTINGDAFIQEGRTDEEKYLEWFRDESEPVDFFVA